MITMTVLEALVILEAATLECKKREADTPELRAALDFFGAAHSTGMAGSTVSPQPRRFWAWFSGVGFSYLDNLIVRVWVEQAGI